MLSTPDERMNRLTKESGGVLLSQSRSELIAGLLGLAIFLGLPLFGYLHGDKNDKILLAFSFGIIAVCFFGVIEYFRVWHVISNEGMDFGRMFKSRGYLKWSEVARVSYLPRKFRLFTPRWFRIETQSGEVVRVSADFVSIQDFGKLILMHVAQAAIEPSTLPVLRAVSNGWRRTSGDKWLDPVAPRVPEGPISRFRAIVGFIVGMGIIPACFSLYFAFSAKPRAPDMLILELNFAWPCFIFFGLFGFLLFRLHRRVHLACAMVALGVFSSVTIAYVAPHFYQQFSGIESQLAKSLLAQSFFCFGTFLSIALGTISNAKKPT